MVLFVILTVTMRLNTAETDLWLSFVKLYIVETLKPEQIS